MSHRIRTPTPGSAGVGPDERPRFLSEVDCHDLLNRVARAARGGGHTTVNVHSTWTGNVRWARNQVTTSGEVRTNVVQVIRDVNGAGLDEAVYLNDISDAALVAAARRAERMAALTRERPQSDLGVRYQPEALPTPMPNVFSDATYQLDADKRAQVARQLAKAVADAGMLSAGYIEVSAHSLAILDTFGRAWYFPYTHAQYSVTVRDSKGTGSGWAGVDGYDWTMIDGPKLSRVALDKCLQSRNPVRIEPGRYTTILEPQAVCDFVGQLVFGWSGALDRWKAEDDQPPLSPFLKTPPHRQTGAPGFSKLGERVVDERITISADPLDAELGFPPFDNAPDYYPGPLQFGRPVFHPVTWIKDGVLEHLAYERRYAARELGHDTGLPNPGAFRMSVSAATTSMEEMIATTKRGLLVTRFDQNGQCLSFTSQLYRGVTRDGLWLIENGKISKPVNNLVFTESILFALNNVEQLGVPQRVFHPPLAGLFPQIPQPVIVPALKIRDFSFTALDDAV